jgi:hypothetical protein
VVSNGEVRRVLGQDLLRRSHQRQAVTAQLLGPEVGRLRRAAVVGLPDQVGVTRDRVDEGAGVDGAAQAALARQWLGRVVGEHRAPGGEGGSRGHREAVPSGIGGVAGLGGVVVEEPFPSPEEDAGGGLGVELLPGRHRREGARTVVVPGERSPPRLRRSRGVNQRLQVVAEGRPGGEGVVGRAAEHHVRVWGVLIEGRLRRGLDAQPSERQGRRPMVGWARGQRHHRRHPGHQDGHRRACSETAGPPGPHPLSVTERPGHWVEYRQLRAPTQAPTIAASGRPGAGKAPPTPGEQPDGERAGTVVGGGESVHPPAPGKWMAMPVS